MRDSSKYVTHIDLLEALEFRFRKISKNITSIISKLIIRNFDIAVVNVRYGRTLRHRISVFSKISKLIPEIRLQKCKTEKSDFSTLLPIYGTKN